jgi:hypothetical protein
MGVYASLKQLLLQLRLLLALVPQPLPPLCWTAAAAAAAAAAAVVATAAALAQQGKVAVAFSSLHVPRPTLQLLRQLSGPLPAPGMRLQKQQRQLAASYCFWVHTLQQSAAGWQQRCHHQHLRCLCQLLLALVVRVAVLQPCHWQQRQLHLAFLKTDC